MSESIGSVAVGVAVCGPPSWALVDWVKTLRPVDGWTLVLAGREDRPYSIATARNKLAETALAAGFDWLLNVDQDAVLHPQTLLRLASWGKTVVGALCFTRYPPIMPSLYAGYDLDVEEPEWRYCQIGETRQWIAEHPGLHTDAPAVLDPKPAGALRPVGFTGCHCLLVHRQVLQDIKDEFGVWFERKTKIEAQGTGIDRDFCHKARAVGHPVYVDRSVLASHYGRYGFGGMSFLAYDQIADWKKLNQTVREESEECLDTQETQTQD